jgi:hypothetical protein
MVYQPTTRNNDHTHNNRYGYSSASGSRRDPSGAAAPYQDGPAYGDDSLGECGVPTSRRFHMPDNGNGVFWNSLEVGLLHFAVVSLEHNISQGTAQRAWLEADLQAVDRSRTPWVVVASHRPLYCSEVSSQDDYENGLHHAALLDGLLAEHRVNLFVAGHYHAYVRRRCRLLIELNDARP